MNDTFVALSEQLIPGSGGRGIERVLSALPHLEQPLEKLLEEAEGRPPDEVLEELDPALKEMLGFVVAGGYLTDPDILESLGYHRRRAQPVSDDLDSEIVELLEVVLERTPRFRRP